MLENYHGGQVKKYSEHRKVLKSWLKNIVNLLKIFARLVKKYSEPKASPVKKYSDI